jgi:hypothetical protein
MSTCNFSVRNASGYYALENYDPEQVQMNAEGRADADRFTEEDDRERGAYDWRDAGQVILSYDLGKFSLPGALGLCVDLRGQIIMRAGYYAGATLDWDLEVNFLYEYFDLNEYWDGQAALVSDVVENALYEIECREGEAPGEATREAIARRLEAIMEEARGTLDGICRDLCEQPLRCVGVFSNGSAIYALA